MDRRDKTAIGVSIAVIVLCVLAFLTFPAETIAWWYLWFFIGVEVFAISEGIGALRLSVVPLKRRLAYVGLMLLRVAFVIGLNLSLLVALRAESLDTLWILLIAGTAATAESFVKLHAQKHLLNIPTPTFRETFR
jgi:hypothetical protein